MSTCSICQREYTGYGNNAHPVNDGRCCDDCNVRTVIPARIKSMRATPDNDPELRRLMDGLIDADEAGDKVGYLKSLPPEQYDRLMMFLCDEIEQDLKRQTN